MRWLRQITGAGIWRRLDQKDIRWREWKVSPKQQDIEACQRSVLTTCPGKVIQGSGGKGAIATGSWSSHGRFTSTITVTSLAYAIISESANVCSCIWRRTTLKAMQHHGQSHTLKQERYLFLAYWQYRGWVSKDPIQLSYVDLSTCRRGLYHQSMIWFQILTTHRCARPIPLRLRHSDPISYHKMKRSYSDRSTSNTFKAMFSLVDRVVPPMSSILSGKSFW